ncbi:hypothetical protein AAZX31_17G074900 [Glycine max]|uniref:Uncharacterized protein n=2 Tax=Glycine subgen. Soja TaxID=1462606 RepID=K7MKG6_SOYBN|nr:hypothetical protein JHK87_046563 [Glycine soja]KAH1117346.1 hypothetical protein GYH30_046578 [Glycine max]KAH1201464.1 hypothetical protein GmHk_17G048154 [Glycine max]KRH03110.1 hypothetical protein GLYMA_17G077200v4 [Glycine max]RZB55778.1 hypothetical protein D0Y65_045183 [Glycine soja]
MENLEKEEAVTPTRRLNIEYNGSDLYDSFEFKQMTLQLNEAIQTSKESSPAYREMTHRHKLKKAIQGSNGSSPSLVFHLNSPFYRRHLKRLYKESTKAPRRISSPQVPDKPTCVRGTREKGFVTRLWLKVKGLLGKKHEGEEGRNQPSKAF